jgi:predicted nucleic acid-binding protein
MAARGATCSPRPVKLFDTDVLIEYLRGNPGADDLLAPAVRAGEAACSVLARFELLAGMRSAERHATRSLLDAMINLPVTENVASRAGEMARTYRRSHGQISAVDYLIAATTELDGADLLTLNVRHFPMFDDLQPAF